MSIVLKSADAERSKAPCVSRPIGSNKLRPENGLYFSLSRFRLVLLRTLRRHAPLDYSCVPGHLETFLVRATRRVFCPLAVLPRESGRRQNRDATVIDVCSLDSSFDFGVPNSSYFYASYLEKLL